LPASPLSVAPLTVPHVRYPLAHRPSPPGRRRGSGPLPGRPVLNRRAVLRSTPARANEASPATSTVSATPSASTRPDRIAHRTSLT